MTETDVWPNLFIVGAARAGTTSLWRYLNQHPDVYMSPEKEPNYFLGDEEVKPGPDPNRFPKDEYLALFEDAEDFQYRGEASVAYLWSEHAPYKIAKRCPDAKIIVSLRDPIERAHSHYCWMLRDSPEEAPDTFYEALLEDLDRDKEHWGWPPDLVEPGLYARPLERFEAAFESESVLIIDFEALKDDSERVLENVASFLEVSKNGFLEGPADRAYNRYGKARNRFAARLRRSRVASRLANALLPVEARKWIKTELLLADAEKPPMQPEAEALLSQIFEDDQAEVASLLAAHDARVDGSMFSSLVGAVES